MRDFGQYGSKDPSWLRTRFNIATYPWRQFKEKVHARYLFTLRRLIIWLGYLYADKVYKATDSYREFHGVFDVILRKIMLDIQSDIDVKHQIELCREVERRFKSKVLSYAEFTSMSPVERAAFARTNAFGNMLRKVQDKEALKRIMEKNGENKKFGEVASSFLKSIERANLITDEAEKAEETHEQV